MGKIHGIYRSEKEIGKVPPVENRCEFDIRSEDWEYQYATKAEVDEWRCPYSKLDGESHCPLHLEVDKKTNSQVINFINNIIEDRDEGRYELLGAKIWEIDLGKINDTDAVLDFRNSEIGRVEAKGSTIKCGFDFSGSVIFRTMIIESRIEGKILSSGSLYLSSEDTGLWIYDSDICGSVDFCDTKFLSAVHITESEFLKECEFNNSDFLREFTIQKSSFNERFYFRHSRLFGESEEDIPVKITENEFENSFSGHGVEMKTRSKWRGTSVSGWLMIPGMRFEVDPDFTQVNIETLDLINAELSEIMDFTGATIEHITAGGLESVGDRATLNFIRCEIGDGFLHWPPEQEIMVDFAGATLGDLRLKPDRTMGALSGSEPMSIYDLMSGPANPLKNVRFFKTKFDGFDFNDYYSELRELEWDIHRLQDNEPVEVQLETGPRKGEDESEDEIRDPILTPENLISTYSHAKNGASETGAHKSASEFFVKEMQGRKAAHRKSALSDTNQKLRERIRSTLRWSLNSFVEMLVGYGERLWAPIAYSILVIVNFSLFYPLAGGISDGEVVYQLSSAGSQGVTQVLFNSLYFSTVTFTTLGYGDLKPIGTTTKVASGIEAFLGSLMIAVLIFALGRKITR